MASPHHHAQRTLASDTAALRRLTRSMSRLGMPIDHDIATVLAGFVIHWPEPLDQRSAAHQLYERGWSMRRIGAELGVGRHHVADLLDGLPRRTGRGIQLPADTRWRILELVAAGQTQDAIAAEVGCAQSAVSRLVREAREPLVAA